MCSHPLCHMMVVNDLLVVITDIKFVITLEFAKMES